MQVGLRHESHFKMYLCYEATTVFVCLNILMSRPPPFPIGVNHILQNFFSAENFTEWPGPCHLGGCWVAKDLGNFRFRKNNVDPPPSPTFSGKIFAFRKHFLGGALEWKGAQILEYTKPVGTALRVAMVKISYGLTSRNCIQGGSKMFIS
jgi:hypothetical protein